MKADSLTPPVPQATPQGKKKDDELSPASQKIASGLTEQQNKATPQWQKMNPSIKQIMKLLPKSAESMQEIVNALNAASSASISMESIAKAYMLPAGDLLKLLDQLKKEAMKIQKAFRLMTRNNNTTESLQSKATEEDILDTDAEDITSQDQNTNNLQKNNDPNADPNADPNINQDLLDANDSNAISANNTDNDDPSEAGEEIDDQQNGNDPSESGENADLFDAEELEKFDAQPKPSPDTFSSEEDEETYNKEFMDNAADAGAEGDKDGLDKLFSNNTEDGALEAVTNAGGGEAAASSVGSEEMMLLAL